MCPHRFSSPADASAFSLVPVPSSHPSNALCSCAARDHSKPTPNLPPPPPSPGAELTVQSIYRTLQQHLHAPPQPCASRLPSPLSLAGRVMVLFVAAAAVSADAFYVITAHAAVSHAQGLLCLAGRRASGPNRINKNTQQTLLTRMPCAALAVLLGCMVGFVVAQRQSKCGEEAPGEEQPQHEQDAAAVDAAASTKGLSPEQQREVLQGLASILASALQAKQQQSEESSGLEATCSIGSGSGPDASSLSFGELGASADAEGLRQRRNARGQSGAH
jgi:hypothetical protein